MQKTPPTLPIGPLYPHNTITPNPNNFLEHKRKRLNTTSSDLSSSEIIHCNLHPITPSIILPLFRISCHICNQTFISNSESNIIQCETCLFYFHTSCYYNFVSKETSYTTLSENHFFYQIKICEFCTLNKNTKCIECFQPIHSNIQLELTCEFCNNKLHYKCYGVPFLLIISRNIYWSRFEDKLQFKQILSEFNKENNDVLNYSSNQKMCLYSIMIKYNFSREQIDMLTKNIFIVCKYCLKNKPFQIIDEYNKHYSLVQLEPFDIPLHQLYVCNKYISGKDMKVYYYKPFGNISMRNCVNKIIFLENKNIIQWKKNKDYSVESSLFCRTMFNKDMELFYSHNQQKYLSNKELRIITNNQCRSKLHINNMNSFNNEETFQYIFNNNFNLPCIVFIDNYQHTKPKWKEFFNNYYPTIKLVFLNTHKPNSLYKLQYEYIYPTLYSNNKNNILIINIDSLQKNKNSYYYEILLLNAIKSKFILFYLSTLSTYLYSLKLIEKININLHLCSVYINFSISENKYISLKEVISSFITKLFGKYNYILKDKINSISIHNTNVFSLPKTYDDLLTIIKQLHNWEIELNLDDKLISEARKDFPFYFFHKKPTNYIYLKNLYYGIKPSIIFEEIHGNKDIINEEHNFISKLVRDYILHKLNTKNKKSFQLVENIEKNINTLEMLEIKLNKMKILLHNISECDIDSIYLIVGITEENRIKMINDYIKSNFQSKINVVNTFTFSKEEENELSNRLHLAKGKVIFIFLTSFFLCCNDLLLTFIFEKLEKSKYKIYYIYLSKSIEERLTQVFFEHCFGFWNYFTKKSTHKIINILIQWCNSEGNINHTNKYISNDNKKHLIVFSNNIYFYIENAINLFKTSNSISNQIRFESFNTWYYGDMKCFISNDLSVKKETIMEFTSTSNEQSIKNIFSEIPNQVTSKQENCNVIKDNISKLGFIQKVREHILTYILNKGIGLMNFQSEILNMKQHINKSFPFISTESIRFYIEFFLMMLNSKNQVQTIEQFQSFLFFNYPRAQIIRRMIMLNAIKMSLQESENIKDKILNFITDNKQNILGLFSFNKEYEQIIIEEFVNGIVIILNKCNEIGYDKIKEYINGDEFHKDFLNEVHSQFKEMLSNNKNKGIKITLFYNKLFTNICNELI